MFFSVLLIINFLFSKDAVDMLQLFSVAIQGNRALTFSALLVLTLKNYSCYF